MPFCKLQCLNQGAFASFSWYGAQGPFTPQHSQNTNDKKTKQANERGTSRKV